MSPKTKKLLVIGWDGVRPDALLNAHTPCADRLRETGAWSLTAQTNSIPLSAPAWSSCLTGVWHDKHRIDDNSYEGKRFDRYPSFLARLADRGIEVASLVGWDRIKEHMDGDTPCKHSNSDAVIAGWAHDLLADRGPDATFIHFDETDIAGHAYGFGPDVPGYIATIEACDRHTQSILDAVRARVTFPDEDWLFITTTDHGGSERDHGIDIPSHRTIWVMVNGTDVVPGEITPAPVIVDVGATALHHMVGAVDEAWDLDGRVIGLNGASRDAAA